MNCSRSRRQFRFLSAYSYYSRHSLFNHRLLLAHYSETLTTNPTTSTYFFFAFLK